MNATLIAVILSIVVIKTKSIMFVLGYHFFWNFTQNMLLSKQIHNRNTLLNLEMNEGFWTGSIRIPESGMAVMIILVLMTIYIYYRFRQVSVGGRSDNEVLPQGGG